MLSQALIDRYSLRMRKPNKIRSRTIRITHRFGINHFYQHVGVIYIDLARRIKIRDQIIFERELELTCVP